MKKFIFLLSVIMPIFVCRLMGDNIKDATVIIKTDFKDKIFFQSESDTCHGYVSVLPDEEIHIKLYAPEYYYYIGKDGRFITVYLTPDSHTIIENYENTIEFKGDNAACNRFILNNPIPSADNVLIPFSIEWRSNIVNKKDELIEKLKSSDLPERFIEYHANYYKYSIIHQLLVAPNMSDYFGIINNKTPNNYYDFLKDYIFDDNSILTYPKWYTVMNEMFIRMEKEKYIPVSYSNCSSIYANRIIPEKLRNEFLLRHIAESLKRGFASNIRQTLNLIDIEKLNEKQQVAYLQLKKKYAEQESIYRNLLAGQKAPQITVFDSNGTKYDLNAFFGKTLVIDFWFSGCMPCKKEMIYMEQLADTLKNANVKFISLSLDSGEQLVSSWHNYVKNKNGALLNFIDPDGFKGKVASDYSVASVPRIVIIDSLGYIAEAFAPRPSDPKLYALIQNVAHIKSPSLKAESTAYMKRLMTAENATVKELIMKDYYYLAKESRDPIANSIYQMMRIKVVEEMFNEKRNIEAMRYIDQMAFSGQKRDVLFICGNTCHENGNEDTALLLVEQAAEMTQKINDGLTPINEEEREKFPVIFGLYSNLLIKNKRILDASPYIKTARKYGNEDYIATRDYIIVLIAEKKYSEAMPLIEKMISDGLGGEEMEKFLKECFENTNTSGIGSKNIDIEFNSVLNKLKKTSMQSLMNGLKQEMICEQAPDFTLTNLLGEKVQLSSFKGKVVVLDFWATWCGPCKAAFPAMNIVKNEYSGKNVEFMFINTMESSTSPQNAVRQYLAKNNFDFNVLFDLKNERTQKYDVYESYKSKGVPVKYVIDKEGNIRFKKVGFSGSTEQTANELSAMIEMLL